MHFHQQHLPSQNDFLSLHSPFAAASPPLALYKSTSHIVPPIKIAHLHSVESELESAIFEVLNSEKLLKVNDSKNAIDKPLTDSQRVRFQDRTKFLRILLSQYRETIAEAICWQKSVRQYAKDTFFVKPLSTTHLIFCTDGLLSANEYSLLKSKFNALKQSRLTSKHNRISVDPFGKGDLVDPSMYPIYFGHTFMRGTDDVVSAATKPPFAEKLDDFQWIPADISVSAIDGSVKFDSDINNLPSFGNYQSPLYSSIALIISKMIPQFELILNGREPAYLLLKMSITNSMHIMLRIDTRFGAAVDLQSCRLLFIFSTYPAISQTLWKTAPSDRKDLYH